MPAGAEYAQAVAWAVETGVTKGTSDTAFSPDSVCTRGQIVTFLHRALGTVPEEPPVSDSEKYALEVLERLKDRYPAGTGFAGGYTQDMRRLTGGGDSVDVQAVINQYWCADYPGQRASTVFDCGGWTAFVSDSIFGTSGFPARMTSISDVRPGDIVVVCNSQRQMVRVFAAASRASALAGQDGWYTVQKTDVSGSGADVRVEYGAAQCEDAYTHVWTRYPAGQPSA